MPSILGNGTSALLAFQRALAASSQNIANATVEGYTRQRVELTNRPGDGLRNNYIGGGVQVTGITRLSDTLVTNRLLDSRGEIGRPARSQTAFRNCASINFLPTATTGLARPWSAFFDAAQGVAAEPASQAARTELLGRAEALMARFDLLQGRAWSRSTTRLMRALQAGRRKSIGSRLKLRASTSRVSRETGLGNASPDMLDQRDRLMAIRWPS
jgi:flagellar hook-associated protein 1